MDSLEWSGLGWLCALVAPSSAGVMATSPKQNEILQLRQDITSEVSRDAPEIARGIFGDNANHPDMAQVPNQQLDQLYLSKFRSGTPADREWLGQEAQRDPQQFLDVAKRIGITIPSEPAPVDEATATANVSAGPPPAPPVAPPAPALAAPAPPTLPAAPAPVPVLAPPPVPAAPPPVILGPNGQPLPPTLGASAGGL